MGYPPYPFKKALFFVKPTGSVKVIISEKVREVNCSLGAGSRARSDTDVAFCTLPDKLCRLGFR
jgi:hypothetical protein